MSVKLPRLLSPTVAPTSLKVGLSSSSTSLMAIEPRGRHRRIADVAFVDRPGDRTGDDRRIVGAGDRHRDLLR